MPVPLHTGQNKPLNRQQNTLASTRWSGFCQRGEGHGCRSVPQLDDYAVGMGVKLGCDATETLNDRNSDGRPHFLPPFSQYDAMTHEETLLFFLIYFLVVSAGPKTEPEDRKVVCEQKLANFIVTPVPNEVLNLCYLIRF